MPGPSCAFELAPTATECCSSSVSAEQRKGRHSLHAASLHVISLYAACSTGCRQALHLRLIGHSTPADLTLALASTQICDETLGALTYILKRDGVLGAGPAFTARLEVDYKKVPPALDLHFSYLLSIRLSIAATLPSLHIRTGFQLTARFCCVLGIPSCTCDSAADQRRVPEPPSMVMPVGFRLSCNCGSPGVMWCALLTSACVCMFAAAAGGVRDLLHCTPHQRRGPQDLGQRGACRLPQRESHRLCGRQGVGVWALGMHCLYPCTCAYGSGAQPHIKTTAECSCVGSVRGVADMTHRDAGPMLGSIVARLNNRLTWLPPRMQALFVTARQPSAAAQGGDAAKAAEAAPAVASGTA